MSDLDRAIDAALARKRAVAGIGEAERGTFSAGAERLRMMFSGFDVDTEELAMTAVCQAANAGSDLRGTLIEILSGVWLDGILVGLFVGQVRETVDATAEDAP